MNAQEKMAQIINYVSDKHPSIVLDKKWNRLLRDMSKELEYLDDLLMRNAAKPPEKVRKHRHTNYLVTTYLPPQSNHENE